MSFIYRIRGFVNGKQFVTSDWDFIQKQICTLTCQSERDFLAQQAKLHAMNESNTSRVSATYILCTCILTLWLVIQREIF